MEEGNGNQPESPAKNLWASLAKKIEATQNEGNLAQE